MDWVGLLYFDYSPKLTNTHSDLMVKVHATTLFTPAPNQNQMPYPTIVDLLNGQTHTVRGIAQSLMNNAMTHI